MVEEHQDVLSIIGGPIHHRQGTFHFAPHFGPARPETEKSNVAMTTEDEVTFADVAAVFAETCWGAGLLCGRSLCKFQTCCKEACRVIDMVEDYGRYWGDVDPAGAAEVRQALLARRPWSAGPLSTGSGGASAPIAEASAPIAEGMPEMDEGLRRPHDPGCMAAMAARAEDCGRGSHR